MNEPLDLEPIRQRLNETLRTDLSSTAGYMAAQDFDTHADEDITALLAEVDKLRDDLWFAADWARVALDERHWVHEDRDRLDALYRWLGDADGAEWSNPTVRPS